MDTFKSLLVILTILTLALQEALAIPYQKRLQANQMTDNPLVDVLEYTSTHSQAQDNSDPDRILSREKRQYFYYPRRRPYYPYPVPVPIIVGGGFGIGNGIGFGPRGFGRGFGGRGFGGRGFGGRGFGGRGFGGGRGGRG